MNLFAPWKLINVIDYSQILAWYHFEIHDDIYNNRPYKSTLLTIIMKQQTYFIVLSYFHEKKATLMLKFYPFMQFYVFFGIPYTLAWSFIIPRSFAVQEKIVPRSAPIFLSSTSHPSGVSDALYWPVFVADPVDTSIITLRPRQNGRHFADDMFKYIFLNENVWIQIKISLKFVPKVPINNIPALVQIMAWRRSGDKPLSQPMMDSLLTHICVTRPQWVIQCNGASHLSVIAGATTQYAAIYSSLCH